MKATADQSADAASEPDARDARNPLSSVLERGASAVAVGHAVSGRGSGAAQQAAALHVQRSHGNAALSGWLARKPAAAPPTPRPADVLIRGQASATIVGDDVSGDLYDAPDDTRPAIGKLKPDGTAMLIGTAGEYYIVIVDGVRAYVRQSGIATAVDVPGVDSKAGWDQKLKDALAKVDAAGQSGAPATTSGGGIAAVSSGPNKAFSADFMALELRLSSLSTWNQEMEDAAALLRDYALWYFTSYHATPLPGNLKIYFDYIGRSSRNDAAAAAMKVKGTRHLGGFVEGGKGSADWCTQASTTAIKDALIEKGSKLDYDKLTTAANRSGNAVSAPAAYAAPLYPGDMVMYLFSGCQHGGHTVTVVDDLGDSFTHISGNATNAGVLIGEKRRLTKAPPNFDLAKATPGPVRDKDGKIDKTETEKVFSASNTYLRTIDSALGDGALVYSIIRYGNVLNALPANP